MREELRLRNFGDEATVCTVEVLVDADFADLFAVKEGRVGADVQRGTVTSEIDDGRPHGGSAAGRRGTSLIYTYRRGPVARGVEIRHDRAPTGWPRASSPTRWSCPPAGEWSTCVEVGPVIDGAGVRPEVPVRRAGRAGHARPSAWPSGAARSPRSRPTTRC